MEPFIAAPVGTGLWLAGGNANDVQRQPLLRQLAPRDDALRGARCRRCAGRHRSAPTPVPGCDPTKVSTSYDNRFYGNDFGSTPDGAVKPNGADMWWDSFPGNTGNCFYGNKAAAGKTVTSEPPALLPDCADGTKPELSVGTGDVANESELVACLAGFTVSGYPAGNSTLCTWTTDADPSRAAAAAPAAARRAAAQRGRVRRRSARTGLSPRLCKPYTSELSVFDDLKAVARALQEATSPVALATPAFTPGRLSSFTCSWWRKADNDHQLGMVQRIRNLAAAGSTGRRETPPPTATAPG